jgi:hypothetical protein
VAPPPPPPFSISFKFVNMEGAEQTVAKEFLARAHWPHLVEIAEGLPSAVSADNLHLGCNGVDLNIKNRGDKEALVSSLVDPDSVVVLFDYKAPRTLTLTIKTLTGKQFSLEKVDGSSVVSRVCDMVQDKEGIPPGQQRLVFGGRQLDKYQTLAEQGVIDGASIHLILRLAGSD